MHQERNYFLCQIRLFQLKITVIATSRILLKPSSEIHGILKAHLELLAQLLLETHLELVTTVNFCSKKCNCKEVQIVSVFHVGPQPLLKS